MSGLRSWWRGGSSTSSPKASSSSSPVGSSLALNGTAATPRQGASSGANTPLSAAQQERSDLDDAMDAAALIMNDDIDGAEAHLRLRVDASSFHLLGLGIAIFTRSILGFEKEIMTEAASRLIECENRAWADMKRAQKEASRPAGGGGWFGRGNTAAAGSGSAAHVSAKAGQYYPAGSEFSLVHAEAQLMNAVILVMQESLTEGVKGFYRLRKAFITLDGLMQTEIRILREQTQGSAAQIPTGLEAKGKMPGSFDDAGVGAAAESAEDSPRGSGKESDSDLEFVDAAEVDPKIEKTLADLSVNAEGDNPETPASTKTPLSLAALEEFDPQAQRAATKLFTNPMDIFVHSGVNMCFGVLLLLISMVPPAFTRVLYVIGFKGDRARGLRMLWQSTHYRNVNSAVAAMVLLGYYNGMLAFSDIVLTEQEVKVLIPKKKPASSKTSGSGSSNPAPPDSSGESATAEPAELADEDDDSDEIIGYPRRRCAALLADMRAEYPESGLWKLEEARMLANAREQDKAIAALQANRDTKMRQVTALNSFELSMNAMYALNWPLAAASFLRCVELNDWSHCIYYYMAGAVELELYRDGVAKARSKMNSKSKATLPPPKEGSGDAAAAAAEGEVEEELEETAESKALLEEAKAHKRKAEEHLRKAPTLAGRKRFMSRQMPLEIFVCRKVKKLEERAEKLGVDLADAVAASPAMEMVWLWNGSKRMGPKILERSRGLLDWARCTVGRDAVQRMKEEVDEAALRDMCDATLLRQLERLDEAKAMLEKVVALPSESFKGPTRDDYVQAAAWYEIAVVDWRHVCNPTTGRSPGSSPEDIETLRRQSLDQCQTTLDKVAKWEGFTLDARIGMRVKVAQQTVQWIKTKRGWT